MRLRTTTNTSVSISPSSTEFWTLETRFIVFIFSTMSDEWTNVRKVLSGFCLGVFMMGVSK